MAATPEPKKFVTASSGWAHLMTVLGTSAPRQLKQSQKARAGLRQLVNKGR